MVVPRWVSADWLLALRVALVGQGLLLALGIGITLLVLFRQTAALGLDVVDWPALTITPVLVLLGWSGAGAGDPLLVTAALYTFLVYRLGFRGALPSLRTVLRDRPRAFALPGKVGVLAAAVLVVVGILMNTLAEGLVGRASAPVLASRIDLTTLVFFSLFVGAGAGLFALASAGGTSITRLVGLSATVPTMVRSGISGARRTLLTGGIGLLAIATLGSLLDTLSAQGLGFTGVLAALIGTLNDLLVRWLDTALLLLLGASKFLHDGGYVWAPFAVDTPTWMWLAIPILLAVYVAGGIQAAKVAQPRSQAEAAKGALLVGPGVAAVSLLAAIGWAGQPFIEDIIPIAIILPSLWGLVALGGAWFWASQHGLPSGIVVQGDRAPPQQPAAAGPPTTHEWPVRQQKPTQQTPPPSASQQGPPASLGGQAWPAPRQPSDPATDWPSPSPEQQQPEQPSTPGGDAEDPDEDEDGAGQPPSHRPQQDPERHSGSRPDVDLDSLPPPGPGQPPLER